MAPNNIPSDLAFLITCIKNGEVKIDYNKVNADLGWTNRSQSQIKYKTILKAHGLEITGKERYTKPAGGAPAPVVAATSTTGASAQAASTTGRRKAGVKTPATEKAAKKAKREDAVGDEKEKSVGKTLITDEGGEWDEDASEDD